MKLDHDITALVRQAQEDRDAADQLVRQYLPFIQSEAGKYRHQFPADSWDDARSVAMFAFYEAAQAYDGNRGAFLPFAGKVIHSRLTDYLRKQIRHSQVLSLDEPDQQGRTLMEKTDGGHDPVALLHDQTAAKGEILEFTRVLADYGLTLSDVAENCPKQDRTLDACHKALAHAKANPQLQEQLTRTGKLPIAPLAAGSGVSRKTLERHRTYMVAILLAYTNGFTIIRGHLGQMRPGIGR